MKQSENSKLKASPKVTFGLLAVLGVITLLLGFASLSQAINQPRDARRAAQQDIFANSGSSDLGGSNLLGENERRLQAQDSDEDGLSDFDELYLYGTSPYLPDSDSDGFTDMEEIKSDHDPNCPTGENCRSPIDESEYVQLEQDIFADLQPTSEELQPVQTTQPDLSNLSADEIRELLVESGQLTQDQLSEIDDETLIQAYREVLVEPSEE